MKLKLRLILASMFFCSLIFAQSNSPTIQFRQDRVQNVSGKKQQKIIDSDQFTQPTKVTQNVKPFKVRKIINSGKKDFTQDKMLNQEGSKESLVFPKRYTNIPKSKTQITTIERRTESSNESTRLLPLKSDQIKNNKNSNNQVSTYFDYSVVQTDEEGKFIEKILNLKGYSQQGIIEKYESIPVVKSVKIENNQMKFYLISGLSEAEIGKFYNTYLDKI